uniref:Uncharacterized protein n=1 Tax=Glossina palpalis gambiensis TaxID=67801 RepID=A0A1B0AZ05_9MUSC
MDVIFQHKCLLLMVDWLVRWLVGWLVGWLVTWLAGCFFPVQFFVTVPSSQFPPSNHGHAKLQISIVQSNTNSYLDLADSNLNIR